ncbi:hypothetical protein BDD12DRAFT_979458, partial [Trichophaea hybrida]
MSSSAGTAAVTRVNRPGLSSTNYRSDVIWCYGCSMRVAKDLTEMKLHRSSGSHKDNCKLNGFYCYPCGKAFLSDTERQAHMKTKKHAIANRDEPDPMPDYPGDQDDTFFQPPQPVANVGAISGPRATTPLSARTTIESPSDNLRAQYDAFCQSFQTAVIASPSGNLQCQDNKLRQSFQRVDVVMEDDNISTRPAATTPAQAPASVASPTPSKDSLRQHWCDGCMDGVSSLTEHVILDTHIENCKRKGFYCELCNKVFLSSKEHQSHNESKKHKTKVEKKAASTPNNIQSQNDISSQPLQPVATEDHDMSFATSTVGIPVQATVEAASSDSPHQMWCEACKVMLQGRGRYIKDHRKSY